MLISMLALLVAAAAILGFVLAVKNRIARARNEVDYALGQVETRLQERHDRIPNLVTTVQRLASHEKAVLEGVIHARHAALGAPPGSAARFEAEASLGRRLVMFQGVAENYPALRADAGFMRQLDDLKETEVLLQRARTYYNDAVRRYFDLLRQAPGKWFATSLDQARPPAYFAADKAAATAPRVSELS